MSGEKSQFLNRDLSRLDYNRRILANAEDASIPLLERLRFLTYCSKNLDEFFMVRVGAARDVLDAEISERSPDGMLPAEQLAAMRQRARQLLADMYSCLSEGLIPEMKSRGIMIQSYRDASPDERKKMSSEFRTRIAPMLTPLAIDPGHPFPYVENLSLNLAAMVTSPRGVRQVVLLKIPQLLPRFIHLSDRRFVPIGSLVMAHLGEFIPTLAVKKAVVFRVIRNSELRLDREEVEDLRASVEGELRRRDRRQIVCLEVHEDIDERLLAVLSEGTRVQADDIYRVPGFLKINDLQEVCDAVDEPSLRYPTFDPRLPQKLATNADIFSLISEEDVLLHRPYDSVTAVIELLHAAATDPAVVAVKQTLYQTDEDSPIIDKLVLAAENGKQVTVVIELQARFEEKRNIALATRLQEAGAQVVYGLVGLQAHAKLCIIVRRESKGLRHYVHLSTGNYKVDTARVYTDIDLLTTDEEIARDALRLVNVLTGFSAAGLLQVLDRQGARPEWQQLIVGPFDYHRALIEMINKEAKSAAEGKPSGIAAKVNALADPAVISALYAAADAGVRIDLIVRGICCLVPRKNLRVVSIVGRFLEHARIVRFENRGEPKVFFSSGDWLPRNFHTRVEILVPLKEPAIAARAASILDAGLKDGTSFLLGSDGSWTRRTGGVSSQERFIEMARAEAVPLGPYDLAIEQATGIRRKKARKQRVVPAKKSSR
ncbi:MAG TPA: polyphosphate kinase 1 [Thermoanaerobaculia bacterium]